jgi:hypothetical protein
MVRIPSSRAMRHISSVSSLFKGPSSIRSRIWLCMSIIAACIPVPHFHPSPETTLVVPSFAGKKKFYSLPHAPIIAFARGVGKGACPFFDGNERKEKGEFCSDNLQLSVYYAI